MNRPALVILALAATAALVTGCGGGTADDNVIDVHTVDLDDGGSVTCVWERSNWDAAAGLSCDWANTTRPAKDVRA